MPTEFVPEQERRKFGRYSEELDFESVRVSFLLSDDDICFIRRNQSISNQFGQALQLGTVRALGTFVPIEEVPKPFVALSAQQLQLKIPDSFEYPGSTSRRHAREIRTEYCYHKFDEQPYRFRFLRWLYRRRSYTSERQLETFHAATHYLRCNRIILPGLTTLERLIGTVDIRLEALITKGIYQSISCWHKYQLRSLLDADRGEFTALRSLPKSISIHSLNRTLEIRARLKELSCLSEIPSHWSSVKFKKMSRYVHTVPPKTIRDMKDEKQLVHLAIWVYQSLLTTTDYALEIFCRLVTERDNEALRFAKEENARNTSAIKEVVAVLKNTCEHFRDAAEGSLTVHDDVYRHITKEELNDAIEKASRYLAPAGEPYFVKLGRAFAATQRFLPGLLSQLHFTAADVECDIPQALKVVPLLTDFNKALIHESEMLFGLPRKFIGRKWRPVVLMDDGSVRKNHYVMCLLLKVRDALKRKDLFIAESDQWNDPRNRLITSEKWKQTRSFYANTLRKDFHFSRQVETWRQNLDLAYKAVAKNLPDNPDVAFVREGIDERGKRFSLTPLEKVPTPRSLSELRDLVKQMLPRVDLPQILLEIEQKVNFTAGFSHVSGGKRSACHCPVRDPCCFSLGWW